MTLIFIELEKEGRGSFDELVDHVSTVLRENFIPVLERNVGPHDPYDRRARNIVTSLMNRLDISHPTGD